MRVYNNANKSDFYNKRYNKFSRTRLSEKNFTDLKFNDNSGNDVYGYNNYLFMSNRIAFIPFEILYNCTNIKCYIKINKTS